MKKIGIITWHYFHNYGGVLQTYALQQYLSKNNYVQIIDYRHNQKTWKNIIKSIIFSSRFLSRLIGRDRDYEFEKFIKKHFKLTALYDEKSIRKINQNQFDKFFVGSDQIWAPTCLDSAYLLDFVNDNNKKYSYASSSVITTNDGKIIDTFKTYLPQFNRISVREQKSKENIEKYIDRKVDVVLDPTLLLNECDYADIIDTKKVPKQDYILCYFLGNRPFYKSVVDSLNVDGYEVYSIVGNGDGFTPYNRLCNLGPKDFLGLIKNCKLFITDSFHGVAFSIIFKKEFLVVERFVASSNINQNPRIEHILNVLSLQDRRIGEETDFSNSKNIDYDKVYDKLNNLRKISYDFIDDCLEDRK